MTLTLANLLQRFLGHYMPVQRGLSTNTVLAYRDTLRLLLCYAADKTGKPVDKLRIEDLGEPLILSFLENLEKNRGCTSRTRNVRLAAIRAFFGFAAREEPTLLVQSQTVRTIPLKRGPHPTIDYLEEHEMQAVLDAVDIRTRTGIRDRALLLLMYNTGARVSEVAQLTLQNLRLDGGSQVELLGKGRKMRICPLWQETARNLQEYILRRQPREPLSRQIFLDAHGYPITRFGVRYVIGRYAAQACHACPSIKTKTITPHTIRHTTAMHLLRAGNDVSMVSYWLGHVDINTTHVYVEIDMEMKRRMLEKAGPPAVTEDRPWKKSDVLDWLNRLAATSELCGVKHLENRGKT